MTQKWVMGLYKEKNRIFLRFEYRKSIIEALKVGVPGAQWSGYESFWHFPLEWDTAKDIMKVAKSFPGTKVSVQKELADWAKAQKSALESILSPDDMDVDASGFLPVLRRECPKLMEAMEAMPWQPIGAQFIVEQRVVLLADQPGMGKTLQTLAAIRELDIQGAILVVAPRSAVRITWPEEIVKWLGPQEEIVVVNAEIPAKDRRELVASVASVTNRRTWVLVGPNYLRIRAELDEKGNYVRDERGEKIIRVVREAIPELFGIKWDAVIVDESHQTTAGATGNIKKQSAQRQGLGALKIKPGAIRIAISGTPFRGKTENIWGTLNWLRPDKYTSYWNWIKRHYGLSNDASAYSGYIKGDQIIDEPRFFNELKPIMIRRTKREIAERFPDIAGVQPKRYGGVRLDPTDESSPVAVWLPMTDKQRKQYRDITAKAMIAIENSTDQITINGVLAQLVRMRQVANSCLTLVGDKAKPIVPSNKLDWILDFIAERVESGTKVIVASQFTSFLEMASHAAEVAGIPNYLFTGKTSDPERLRIKKEFQSDYGDMIIFLNVKAGGVSLTLDYADDVVMVDQTENPDDQEQVEDRAHRISRFHDVNIYNLASLDTIDEDTALINKIREDQNLSVLDGQRGKWYVKELLDATERRMKNWAA